MEKRIVKQNYIENGTLFRLYTTFFKIRCIEHDDYTKIPCRLEHIVLPPHHYR